MKIRLKKTCDFCVRRKIKCIRPLDAQRCNQCVQRKIDCIFSPANATNEAKVKEFQLKERKRKACDYCIKAKTRCSGPDHPGGHCSLCVRKKRKCVFSMTSRKCRIPKQGVTTEAAVEVIKCESPDLKIKEPTPPNYGDKKPDSLFLLAKASQENEALPVQDPNKQSHSPTSTAVLPYSSPSPAMQPFFSPSPAIGMVGNWASQYLSSFVYNTENIWPTSNRCFYTPALSSFLKLGHPSLTNTTSSTSREIGTAEHSSLLSAIAMGALLQGDRHSEMVNFCVEQSRKLLPLGDMACNPTSEQARALMQYCLLCHMLGNKESFKQYLPAVENMTTVLNGPSDIQSMVKFCNASDSICDKTVSKEFITRLALGEEAYTPEELSKYSLPYQFFLCAEAQFMQGRLLFKNEPDKLANIVLSSYESMCFAENMMLQRQPIPSLEVYTVKLGKSFVEFVSGSHMAALSSASAAVQIMETLPGVQFCPLKLHDVHYIAMLFHKVGDAAGYNRLKAATWEKLPDYNSFDPLNLCDSFYCRQTGHLVRETIMNTDPYAGVVGGKMRFQKEWLLPENECEKVEATAIDEERPQNKPPCWKFGETIPSPQSVDSIEHAAI